MLDIDIIWTTTGMYEAFMAQGRTGLDAYVLYSHLIYTSRRQNTNSVWAVDSYLKNGLQWGNKRILAAKNLLISMDIIEITQKRDDKGVFQKSYTKVKTSRLLAISPECYYPQTDTAVNGCQATNALKDNGSALKEKRIYKFIPPSNEEVYEYSKEIGYQIDPEKFICAYEQKNWMIGKSKMKSWKAAVRNWKANGWGKVAGAVDLTEYYKTKREYDAIFKAGNATQEEYDEVIARLNKQYGVAI